MCIDLAPDFVLEQLDVAEATGVGNPVLLGFAWLSPHAMAIVEGVGGAPLSPPDDPEIADGCVALCTGAAAGELLRRYAGYGGEIVARLMADHPDVDIWSVGLLPDCICCAAYSDGRAVFFGDQDYEEFGPLPPTRRVRSPTTSGASVHPDGD